MIRSFKCKETEKIWNEDFSKKFHKNIQKKALNKMRLLDASNDINDLRIPPGNRLEELSGNRYGQYSIRVNEQWRICFVWNNCNAEQVEIVDYH